jgi:hypothetical protein
MSTLGLQNSNKNLKNGAMKVYRANKVQYIQVEVWNQKIMNNKMI